MDLLWALAFAFAVGLTINGFLGAIMEIAFGTRLRLAPPYIAPDHLVLSLAASLAAGPFMLVNHALGEPTGRRLRPVALAACLAVAFAWTLATGIIVTELAILLVRG